MNEVCQICGLPKNLCVCSEIEKEGQRIKARVMKRRFGKVVTTISGIENQGRAKELEKILKRKLACGGTVKGTEIELQGDHKKHIKEILMQQGYKEELLDV
ncbi:MAG: stress response translation initiation inhibitor YciH [Candidatus Diapherotrites archaeon]